MIKNNFRILKKQYAYLQTILKTPVKFQKDWPKTVGGVADTRMVVGADGRTDRRIDRRTDTQNFGGYNIIPRHFLVAGHKNDLCAQRRLGSAWALALESDQGLMIAKDISCPHVDTEDSDRTGRMPRLIWVFAGCTCHFVGLVVRRLKYNKMNVISMLNIRSFPYRRVWLNFRVSLSTYSVSSKDS